MLDAIEVGQLNLSPHWIYSNRLPIKILNTVLE